MKTLTRVILFCLLFSSSLFTFSKNNVDKFFDVDNQTIEIIVNGEKIAVQNLPQNGFVEVFNILGSKVMSFQVNGGKSTTRLNLPRGYYILKSVDGSRKIVVK